MNSIKKIVIYTVPAILLVLSLTVSYAYWRKSVEQENVNTAVVNVCMESTLTDVTSAINLNNDFPISDSAGMNRNPYTFTVTNTCDSYIKIDITLETLSTTTLGRSYIKVALNDLGNTTNTSQILTAYPSRVATIAGATSNSLKANISVPPWESVTYDFRMWINEPTTLEQGSGKAVDAKIVINVSPSDQATSPVMISIPTGVSAPFASDFVGATWNHKTAALEISSVASDSQKVNLTNLSTDGAVNLATFVMGRGTGNGVWNEPSTDYRYEGKNPNNYIAFNGEMWRIIGVFSDNTHGLTGQKLVKIIRDQSIGGIVYDKSNRNDWSVATLKELLNTNYYNGIDEAELTNCYFYSTTIPANCNFSDTGITKDVHRDLIENVTWKMGGMDTIGTAQNTYTAERAGSVFAGTANVATGYVGIMYPSDYGYSVLASTCARSVLLGAYNTDACNGQSWLSWYAFEYVLMPRLANGSSTWIMNVSGVPTNTSSINGAPVRPVLYLKSNTLKVSGTGTYNDPYTVMAP